MSLFLGYYVRQCQGGGRVNPVSETTNRTHTSRNVQCARTRPESNGLFTPIWTWMHVLLAPCILRSERCCRYIIHNNPAAACNRNMSCSSEFKNTSSKQLKPLRLSEPVRATLHLSTFFLFTFFNLATWVDRGRRTCGISWCPRARGARQPNPRTNRSPPSAPDLLQFLAAQCSISTKITEWWKIRLDSEVTTEPKVRVASSAEASWDQRDREITKRARTSESREEREGGSRLAAPPQTRALLARARCPNNPRQSPKGRIFINDPSFPRLAWRWPGVRRAPGGCGAVGPPAG